MPHRTSHTSRRNRAPATGKVRIIGGEWRGRWIRFIDAEGLRPTGDRMRETLFNWVQPRIHGARCLDLFAGTGALGIEAVSRGAAQSVLIEQNPTVSRQLENEIQTLFSKQQDLSRDRAGAPVIGTPMGETGQRLSVHTQTAETFLQNPSLADGPFDIVFIDPPFALDIQISMLVQLRSSGLLANEALIYLEAPASVSLEVELPATYEVYRSSRQGNTQCLLLKSIES